MIVDIKTYIEDFFKFCGLISENFFFMFFPNCREECTVHTKIYGSNKHHHQLGQDDEVEFVCPVYFCLSYQ